MTAMALCPPVQRKGISPLFLGALLLFALVLLSAVHAANRHGAEAQAAIDCEGKGTMISLINPDTQRKGVGCRDNGIFYIIIHALNNAPEFGDDDVVTAFQRKQAASMDDLRQYLLKAGYILP